ncbi:hypothetical protein [Pseudoalteromonas luteoviolacea]|uniref:hypothetical protein n=1 Tax=Pseudoalteromonas luteoviolacea TaxID=43657 RepID=UPI0011500CB9|nr:hypothetical protein [Pseudoalteromonas luteoviolacea]TQF69569.1 hypothetical protein FLM44_00180 [Pseudoalteromonas luteoviolacea]
MTQFFAFVDWAVIGVKLVALASLFIFAKQSALKLLIEKPSIDIREQVEQSLFLLTAFSLIWHFSGSYMSMVFSKMEIAQHTKIQIYYFFFSFHDVLGLAILAGLHWLKDCKFSKICRWVYYLTSAMILLQVLRYIDRVYFEGTYLNLLYMPIKTGINMGTVALICAYPVLRILRFIPNRQWE